MLTRFIEKNLRRARYKFLADGTFFGEVPGLRGVWANARTLEDCRQDLRETLEGWLLLKVRDAEKVPGLRLPRRVIARYA